MDGSALVDRIFDVEVVHDPEVNRWGGVCEPLGIVIEAGNYDEVIRETWLVVPDLLDFDALGIPLSKLRIRFTVATSIKSRTMANAILKQAGLEKAF